ncbi:MAG: hypothetical protein EOP54_07840 [Sphingobacteriales bacterium]|nr:MAG: hypothetical protein EOP54_07840 [Sphingobacteriales bacterium]
MIRSLIFTLFTCFVFFIPENGSAQQNVIQLKEKLHNAANNSAKVAAYEQLLEYYFSKQETDSFIKYAVLAIPVYEQAGNTFLANKSGLALSLSYMSKGDVKNSERYMPKDENYFAKLKDHKRQARADYNRATILATKYQQEQAESYYTKILDEYNKGYDIEKHLIFKTYEGLFGNYVYSQQYSKALKTANNYTSFIEKYYPENIGYVYFYLGGLYRHTSDYRKAINTYLKGVDFYKNKSDGGDYVASGRLQVGISYLSLGIMDSARIYLESALKHYQADNNQEAVARVYNALSSVAFEEKKLEQAETYIQKALQFTAKENDNYLYDNAFMWTIRLAKEMEDSALIKTGKKDIAALKHITAEMERNFETILAKKAAMTPGLLAHNYSYLSAAHALLGNYEKAFHYFKSGIELKDSIQNISQLRAFTDMETSLAYEKQNELLKLSEANKRLQLQKELELEALRYEFEKKQAAATTEEERQKLVHEEALKRKEIEIKYDGEQKAVLLKYEQEKEIARLEQEKKDAIAGAELQSARNVRNLSALGVGLATLLLAITGWSYFQKRKDNKRIALEKGKSDELLLNILPYEVAEELKEKGTTSAQLHDKVSVLFTDFVNFTANAEKIGVQELLEELNECFTAFDQIMERYGLEKIKTIGDAYLAVSGLPASNPRHAQNAVLAAKDILTFITARRAHKSNALDIRIGINSGPVVAGIVGVKKFAYDIWGDAVNTAARMEQNSKPGRINISATTYELVNNEFDCEARGSIETKGKGAIAMYFVN